jgi:hypothetical protein
MESLLPPLWEVPDFGERGNGAGNLSKRSSSDEGGLLLDPLHMRTHFPSVPIGIVRTDVNGFPTRLIRPFPV